MHILNAADLATWRAFSATHYAEQVLVVAVLPQFIFKTKAEPIEQLSALLSWQPQSQTLSMRPLLPLQRPSR